MLIPTDVEVRRGADFPNLPKNEEACAVRRHPKQRGIVSCECYLLSYRGKRSINYPAQGNSCNIFPPSERRDLRDDSVDGSPHTAIRPYPNFDPNPGDPGRHVYNKTHAQAFLLKEMFVVGSELVCSTIGTDGIQTFRMIRHECDWCALSLSPRGL